VGWLFAAEGSKTSDGMVRGALLHPCTRNHMTPLPHQQEQNDERNEQTIGQNNSSGIQPLTGLTNGVCAPHITAHG